MCGICGYIDYKGDIKDHILEKMVFSIRHRGPDDKGVDYFQTPLSRVALGHTRLSILDLSKAGHQPMHYENLIIVFNGEVYNFIEIRDELIKKGHHFNSNSDTEVILHSFKEWHTDCVNRFIGMFAFVIYDQTIQKLYMCRDRAGVKPFYYYISSNFMAFASELKPLMAIPQFKRYLSEKSLSTFLKIGHIPGEMCIYKDTYKLDGGCWAEYDIEKKTLRKWCYWNIEDYYSKPKLNISYEDAKKEIKDLFKSAFGYRLVSDVPIGVLLSGGFDSAAVTAILTKELGIMPRTFTIGFHDYINEAPDAEKISGLLGTQHTTYYCTEKDVIELIPKLSQVYDEPFADPSALPSMLVSMVVRKNIPVVLSADGGDEIFAGYDSYERLSSFYPFLEKIPKVVRNHIHIPIKIINRVLPYKNNRAHNFLIKVDETLGAAQLSEKAWYDNRYITNQKLINSIFPQLSNYDYRNVYSNIMACLHTPEYPLIVDWKTRMKDEFLIKVDRAMMAVSLEGREPMLDHRIAEYVAQLPWEYKYKDGVKKRILKDIVYDYLPKKLMDKPKRGFTPPLSKWMRSEVRDYVRSNIEKIDELDIDFNKALLNNMVDSFMNGDESLFKTIWNLVQLSSWNQAYVRKSDLSC